MEQHHPAAAATDAVSREDRGRSMRLLKRSAQICFAAIAGGQLLFIAFIVAFYYPSTLSGRWSDWDNKPLIEGHVAGDPTGNAFFAVHVILAAVITFAGLLQLLPALRSRVPAIHRWTGRVYMLTAAAMALGGLWLVWVRGTYLNTIGALGISMNAVLILSCAALAWNTARARRFGDHRRWALRLFAVVSAVWYMRVGYMAWGIATGGAGIGKAMDGWFDITLAFANSLVPLTVTEAYLRAQAARGSGIGFAVSGLLFICALIVAGGSVGAWLMMWRPYL